MLFFFLVLTFFFFDRLEIKIEAFSLCWIFFFLFRRAMRFSSDKFFVVACFCYTACLPCSLGFRFKLYINILSLMSIFIWWLYISLNTTFLQWCLSPYYQIIALQQQSLSDIHPWRSYSGSHLGNNVIIGIPDTMMLLLVLDNEVVLAFVLAIKLHQHLSFQCSHLKSLCNVATLKVFTMNPRQHSSLYWSHANIHLCQKAIFVLTSTMK